MTFLKWLKFFSVVSLMISIYSISTVANADLKYIETLVSEQKFDKAIDQLTILLSEADAEKKAALLNAIGWGYLKLGDYLNAEKNLIKSQKLALNFEDNETAMLASNNLGILNYLQNNLEISAKYFGGELNQNTETAKLYIKLIEIKRNELLSQKSLESGTVSRRKKDFKKAIEEYDVALKYKPRNAAALAYKGYALLRGGKYDLSIDALTLAKNIDPSRKLIYLNLVKVNCKLNSEQGVNQSIEDSQLPKQQFIDWHKQDAEFRHMCVENTYITELIESQKPSSTQLPVSTPDD